jgi:hypothetical protein
MAAQVLEALMLVCFGVGWPISMLKVLRTRRAEGKSALFMVLVLLGYAAGIAAKFVRAAHTGAWPELVTGLYALNAVFVTIDLGLVLKYGYRAKA